MIIVLVSIICVYPYLLYIIKWLDVLGKIFVYDGTDVWAGVQKDVDERVQFSVDGDTELGRHCGKG